MLEISRQTGPEDELTKVAISRRERVRQRIRCFRDTPIRLNVDRALHLTQSMKRTEGQPLVFRWAQALKAVLDNHAVHIEPTALLAGSAGPPGRYAVVYPELAGRFLMDPASMTPSGPDSPVIITREDIDLIRNEIVPYWDGRRFLNAWDRALPEDTRSLMNRILVVTPTAWARSHLAFAHDYQKVIGRGLASIKQEAADRLLSMDPMDTAAWIAKRPFLESVILVCDAVVSLANRYADLAGFQAQEEADPQRKRELLDMAQACRRVPEYPARTFQEALQCQWLIQVVSRLEQSIGGGVSNGRMDQYLRPFFERDKRDGQIDDDGALALLESAWLGIANSTELYALPGQVSFTDGFAHWEAVTIGGQTPDGQDATNELSYLILRSKREFPLGYPDLAARIHARTPNRFLHDVCETIKEGTGFPKLFFDEEIVPLLVSKGGPVAEAHDYCIVGCTEVKMLNRDAAATGCALVNLGAVLEMAMYDGRVRAYGERIGAQTGAVRGFGTYQELWDAFCCQAKEIMRHTFIQQYVADTLKSQHIASPFFSMTHDLCMRECMDIHAGPVPGGLYLAFFDTIGFGTVVDSLAAVKYLVFDQKRISMEDLLEALDVDFEGREAIRQLCVQAPKYGNDIDWVDSIGHDVEELFASLAHAHTSAFGGELDVRYVSITSHVPFGLIVGATPDGRRARQPLSESISPSQGADTRGPTATLNSIAKTRCGAYRERAARLLNLKLTPAAVAGPEGTRRMMDLVRAIGDKKMWHVQFNVIDRDTLLAAQREPDKYRDLIIRVAGYSAYFVDLRPELQNEIIRRTEHSF